MGLSDFKIKSLKPAPGRRIEVADEHGLYIEVQPSGAKIWRYRYLLHGRREKVTVGPYPEIGVAKARGKRFDFAKMVVAGESPAKATQREKAATRKASTVSELGEQYLAEVVRPNFRRSVDAERYFTRDIFPALGNYKLTEVRPQDVLQLLDAIKARGKRKAVQSAKDGKRIAKASGAQSAKQARTLLKSMFDYAVARHLIAYNPASVIPRRIIASIGQRKRALSPSELRTLILGLIQAVESKPLIIAMQIILLTLVRKGELIQARWSDINFEKRTWNLPTSKTGEPHVVPLSAQTIELIEQLRTLSADSEWVLPGRNPKLHISDHTLNVMMKRHKDFGLQDFVIHDLRRTASTLLHEQGFHPDVIEKALNHSIGGIRGIYNVAKYMDQRREMLQAWANYLDELISKSQPS